MDTQGTLKILRTVRPEQLMESRALLSMLMEAMKDDPHGLTVEDVVNQIYNKTAVVWTWGGGVMVTSIHTYPLGSELLVTHIAGRDYLKNLPKIEEDVLAIAKACNCKWVAGFTKHPGLIRAYEKIQGRVANAYVIRSV
jgi:hypothetical protein